MGIKGEMPYRHGGYRPENFRSSGLHEKSILDFSVNLNPFGPPAILKENWSDLFVGIVDYPSVEGEGIGLYYKGRYSIPTAEFLAGNGSTEMIYLIPKALGFKSALVVTPSFHDYSRATLLAGASLSRYILSSEGGAFIPDIGEIMERMKHSEALWIGSPNNPTGSLYPRDGVLEICGTFPEKWIIVDEAFISFVEEKELFSFLSVQRPENLLVLHSLTKFYGLAGIRMGGVVASEEVIRRLKRFKEPWTVNGIAERIAPLLLECGDYEEETLSLIRTERARLTERLRGLGVLVVDSPANFVLGRWRSGESLDDLLIHLLSEGIYIRDCRNFPGLEGNWFRVAVKMPGENDRLISALSCFP